MSTSDNTPNTIQIPLTKGYVAIVDEVDADLAQYKWQPRIGRKDNTAYAQRSLPRDGGKRQLSVTMHCVVMERVLGRPLMKSEKVDHIDRNGMNNARGNLRVASSSQNQANSKVRKNNKLGVKGVSRKKNKYCAQINVNRKVMYLGLFNTVEEAHEAYMTAAREFFGEFARGE